MNYNGKQFIDIICDRLNFLGKDLTDNEICTLIRSLNRHELNQIMIFGIVDKWHNDKLNRQEEIHE